MAYIDLVIYSGELDDEDQEEKILGVKYEEAKIVDMKKAAQAGRVPEGILTDAMKTEMDSLPKVQAPSLMEKPALEAPVTEPQPSLMAPQQG